MPRNYRIRGRGQRVNLGSSQQSCTDTAKAQTQHKSELAPQGDQAEGWGRAWPGHSCSPTAWKRHFWGCRITHPALILITVMLWDPKVLSQKGKKPQAPLRAHIYLEIHRNFTFLSHPSPASPSQVFPSCSYRPPEWLR